ncbi:hypothetical protein [Amycolatopsis coloradensis]|nr:hypothetical protein [Amycolatopsis coloradensis]
MLLIQFTVLVFGVLYALVFLAAKIPAATPLVVAGLLSPLLNVIRAA